MADTTIHIAPTADVQRLVEALNVAKAVGIKFKVGPNPHIHQDSTTGRYVPTVDALLDEDFPTTWEGGHSLVIEYGDCEFYGRCQCGKDFGMQTPNKPLDDFGSKWERHVMTEVGR